MDSGFDQGKSDNLPKIDSLSLFSYLGNNPDFVSAEMRNIKAGSSARENYGDHAVGYVQVKRAAGLCTVKGKVTPEHRVRNKAYNVVVECNEHEEQVLAVKCEDCAASLGGCKHGIAFLMWLHRRSEEPATTSTTNYWKKSKLSDVGKSLKFIKGRDLGKASSSLETSSNDRSFLHDVIEQSRSLGKMDTVLGKYFKEFSLVEKLSVHYLCGMHFDGVQLSTVTAEHFLEFCATYMTLDVCRLAEQNTRGQADSPLWYQLRYCRITASKAYEAAHCNTFHGSLVEAIFGATKLKDTAAMKRGRALESEVLKAVEKAIGGKVEKCGLVLSSKYPVLGASPDGITETFTIEVKCPASVKAMGRYITKENKIAAKYAAQVQLQMYFCKKQKAVFCVALPTFEDSKNVKILYVPYDEKYCTDLLQKCILFWKNAIFPKLKENYCY